MARKAQDPLGDVKALMTDNTIAFGGGPHDDTTSAPQLQPAYSIKNGTRFNMIARGIVPILGVDPGVVVPPLGPNPRPINDQKWGLSDTMLQYFCSPKSEASVKWGIGPQVSLKTRSGDRQAGPGWGEASLPLSSAVSVIGPWVPLACNTGPRIASASERCR